jgi:CCR4-NOT transcription complex subunit 7/8
MTSGLCINPNNHWITFHGGVDFGYMLKTFLGQELPKDEQGFFEGITSYFCNFYDIKEIKRDVEYLTGGLSKVAKELDVERIGTMH